MKKIFTFGFFITLSLNVFGQLDTSRVYIISDTFCFSNKKSLPFTAGSKILIQCDTVYIINKHRYLLYEKAADVIREKKYVNACNVLIQNYENKVDAQNKAFYKLYADYIKLDSVSQKTIAETRSSLVQVNNTLVKAQTDIVVVDKKMDDIKKTINKQRVQSFFDKIIYGTGGVAVGILVALLIAK